MGFEWDPAKAESNLAKHGITFREAVAVFSDPKAIRQDVTRDDLIEDRTKVTGRAGDQILTVVYTVRASNLRIISARRSHRNERRDYARQGDTE